MHLLWGFFLLSWQNFSSSYAQKEAKIAFSILKVYTIICIKQYRGRYFIETFLPPIYTQQQHFKRAEKNNIAGNNGKAKFWIRIEKVFIISVLCSLSLSSVLCFIWSIKWLLNVFIFNVISICERDAQTTT